MPRRKKNPNAARIQKAVDRIQIPLSQITEIYAHAEQLIAEGADDTALRNGIAAKLGLT